MAEHQFIALDYTGKADGRIFDTTRKQDARPGAKGDFEPVIVKLGGGQLISGLDAFLRGKEPGHYEVTLAPQDAFGTKSAKMLRLVPRSAFGKQAKDLAPGMPITVGDTHGIVKSVSGGRIVVDFNHPLAGKEVHYDLDLHGEVTDPVRIVTAVVQSMLGAKLQVTQEDGGVHIALPEGFPADGILAEIEKYTGIAVKVKFVALPKQSSKHTHEHSHAGEHDHDHHDHSHHGHNH